MTSPLRARLQGVCKNYRLYDSPLSMLKQFLSCGLGRYYAEFPALCDVDLEIREGETLGIIGHNGAGKSTLLELISQISAPTKGRAEVRGKVVSLLELGAGLNPDLTGRENIFLYGAVLGMRRGEISLKFDEIVRFTDISMFLDQPARTYSNGMLLRLAFAIAVHADADLLVCDEVLAVGDGRFQYKCFNRIQELQKKGMTIVLASHNLDTITSLCSRVIVLDQGRKYFDGPPREAYWAYCRLVSLPIDQETAPATAGGPSGNLIGTGEARFTSTRIIDNEGRSRAAFRAGESCEIKLRFVCDNEVGRGSFGIAVHNHHGLTVYGYNTASNPLSDFAWRAGAEHEASIRLALNLTPGKYFVSLVLNRLDQGHVVALCSIDSLAEITITERAGVFGAGNLFAAFEQKAASSGGAA